MKYYLTLVSKPQEFSLSENFLNNLNALLQNNNIVILERRTLSDQESYEILLDFSANFYDDYKKLLANFIADLPVDYFLMPYQENRIKKLFITDMDSTLIEQECIDEIARNIGKYDQVAQITQNTMQGNELFEGSLEQRVALLKGTECHILDKILAQQITFSEGAETMIKNLKKHGVILAVASGGFDYFTGAIKKQLGLDYDFANKLEIQDGKLTGKLIPPIYGSKDKANSLENLMHKYQINSDEVIAIGDGSNDIEMLQTVDFGIAYHAKPVVNNAAKYHLKHSSLITLLFMQGIARKDFI